MHKRSHGLRQQLEGKSLRLIFTVVFLLTVCVLTATIIALLCQKPDWRIFKGKEYAAAAYHELWHGGNRQRHH